MLRKIFFGTNQLRARVVYLFYAAVLTALLFQSCLLHFPMTTTSSSLSVYGTYMQTYSPITGVCT